MGKVGSYSFWHSNNSYGMFKAKNFICQELQFHSISWQRYTYKYRTHVRLLVSLPRKSIIKRIAKQRMFVFSLRYFCFLWNCLIFIKTENMDLMSTCICKCSLSHKFNASCLLYCQYIFLLILLLKCRVFTVTPKYKIIKKKIVNFAVLWNSLKNCNETRVGNKHVHPNMVNSSKF